MERTGLCLKLLPLSHPFFFLSLSPRTDANASGPGVRHTECDRDERNAGRDTYSKGRLLLLIGQKPSPANPGPLLTIRFVCGHEKDILRSKSYSYSACAKFTRLVRDSRLCDGRKDGCCVRGWLFSKLNILARACIAHQ